MKRSHNTYMFKALKKWTDDSNRELKKAFKVAEQVLALEDEYTKLTDEELKAKTDVFRTRLKDGEMLNDIMVEAFATVREAAWRVLGMKPFPVQIQGGYVLNNGDIAEMRTGEGKTLTATMPVYLNALSGDGVHVITVNEYLAARDAEEMGRVYTWLGLTVGLNLQSLSPAEKRAAYNCDVTYGINSEFGFDYLRDNMVVYKEDKVQRELNYAVVDEVDSIFIDEARTPLIISGGKREKTKLYREADAFAKRLKEDQYTYDPETKTVVLTDAGVDYAEKHFRIANLFEIKHTELFHRINQALRANIDMHNEVDYVVQDGEVLIVDQSTGRIMQGRRYNDGLHQALEAKEGLDLQEESMTLATVTYQNYFRLYKKLAGMTGTAKTEEEEFLNTYNQRVVQVPTNKPMVREDAGDLIFATKEAKYKALIEEIKTRHENEQPLLIGTVAIETSEIISELLDNEGIAHEVLNAKQHEREAEIIAQAGQKGAVTIATNMAGRGTDIKLGDGVADLGGLAVIGTERHDSRRIDLQLQGRSGRQGDPGYSRFYISMDDRLLEQHGGDAMRKRLSLTLGDEALESRFFSKTIISSQKRAEGRHYDIRKQLVEYDEVLRKQRELTYEQRDRILYADESIDNEVQILVKGCARNLVQEFLPEYVDEKLRDYKGLVEILNTEYFHTKKYTEEDFKGKKAKEIESLIHEDFKIAIEKRHEAAPEEAYNEFQKVITLHVIDEHWMKHIDAMAHLREGIDYRAYAQEDPLHAYEDEAFVMFIDLNKQIANEVALYMLRAEIRDNQQREEVVEGASTSGILTEDGKPVIRQIWSVDKISRNGLCPCGSGKKFKHCHGKPEKAAELAKLIEDEKKHLNTESVETEEVTEVSIDKINLEKEQEETEEV